jgi:hypothetical protein
MRGVDATDEGNPSAVAVYAMDTLNSRNCHKVENARDANSNRILYHHAPRRPSIQHPNCRALAAFDYWIATSNPATTIPNQNRHQ